MTRDGAHLARGFDGGQFDSFTAQEQMLRAPSGTYGTAPTWDVRGFYDAEKPRPDSHAPRFASPIRTPSAPPAAKPASSTTRRHCPHCEHRWQD